MPIIHCRGICEQEEGYRYIENLIPSLAKAYLHVFYKACENDTLFSDLDGKQSEKLLKAREFFGLRDFYRLLNYDYYLLNCLFVALSLKRVRENEALERNNFLNVSILKYREHYLSYLRTFICVYELC